MPKMPFERHTIAGWVALYRMKQGYCGLFAFGGRYCEPEDFGFTLRQAVNGRKDWVAIQPLTDL